LLYAQHICSGNISVLSIDESRTYYHGNDVNTNQTKPTDQHIDCSLAQHSNQHKGTGNALAVRIWASFIPSKTEFLALTCKLSYKNAYRFFSFDRILGQKGGLMRLLKWRPQPRQRQLLQKRGTGWNYMTWRVGCHKNFVQQASNEEILNNPPPEK